MHSSMIVCVFICVGSEVEPERKALWDGTYQIVGFRPWLSTSVHGRRKGVQLSRRQGSITSSAPWRFTGENTGENTRESPCKVVSCACHGIERSQPCKHLNRSPSVLALLFRFVSFGECLCRTRANATTSRHLQPVSPFPLTSTLLTALTNRFCCQEPL